MNIFIIDDEGPVRRELRYLLGRIEGVNVVGESANGSHAMQELRALAPDVVFLDIQMPGLSGLELTYLFGDLPKKPLLVFVTAYEEHAVQAFELDALDYILKPFTLERLKKSIDKARRYLRLDEHDGGQRPPGSGECQGEQQAVEKRVPLYDGERIVPTHPRHIFHVTSDEGRITVHAVHGRYTAKATIAELEARLAPHGFFRAHRSHLVNLNHVAEIVPWTGGSYKLILSDPERSEIVVSRYNTKDLKAHFDI